MPESGLIELLSSLGAQALAPILTLWAIGHLVIQGLKIWLDRKQRGQIVESVKETSCHYPEDLAEGTRRALYLQDRFAEEQQAAIGRLEGVIRELVQAMDRREERQANTMQILSNAIGSLTAELRTLTARRTR